MARRLVSRTEVDSLLSTLFQRSVESAPIHGVDRPTGAIASYRGSDGRLSGAMWVDRDFTLATSAALCLLSNEHIEEALADSPHLPPRWHDHFREIANVCARFFGALEAPRVALDHVWIAPTPPPMSLMDEMTTLLQHRILDVSFGTYGRGQLHLVAV